jgi:hypothetical protein
MMIVRVTKLEGCGVYEKDAFCFVVCHERQEYVLSRLRYNDASR